MNEAASADKPLSAALLISSRLKAILGPVTRFLFFSPADDLISYKKGLSVSIEKGRMTAVSGSRFLSRVSVRNAREFPIDPESYPDPETCSSAAAMAAAETGIRKALALSIPKAWTIATVAEFPSTIRENFLDAMQYELDRLTPFSPDEALYDFRILRETEDRITVLVVAAKADAVMPYVDALREKGLIVSCVTSGLSSVGALCRFSRDMRDFIFIRETEDSYETMLFTDGLPENVSSVTKVEEKDGLQASLLEEAATLVAGLREKGRQPQIVLETNGAGTSFGSLLSQKTGAPVTLADELIQDNAVPLKDRLRFISSYGSLIELLWPKAGGLDLLSRGKRKKERAPLLLTVLLACAVIVSGIVYLYAPLQLEKKRSAEIDLQISSRKDEVRKVEELKKEIDTLTGEIGAIGSFREKKPLSVNIVKEVTSVLPNAAWLTRLKISETQVEIEGYAGSATELIPKLEASKYLSRVELASTTVRDQRMNADRFVIRAELEGVKKDDKTEGGKHEKK